MTLQLVITQDKTELVDQSGKVIAVGQIAIVGEVSGLVPGDTVDLPIRFVGVVR